MENPIPIPEGERSPARARVRSHGAIHPIVLPLPSRRNEDEDHEASLEKLEAIVTGTAPQVEMALLTELLTRSPGLAQGLADPHETHHYHHPLAGVNAYKHRLHALRCEFVNTRLRTVELEEQLAKARERIVRLENHVAFLEDALTHMRQSRAWQWAERCSRWSGWFKNFFTTNHTNHTNKNK